MDNDIEKFLDEFEAYTRGMGVDRENLKEIIITMVDGKPESKIDESFKESLKTKIVDLQQADANKVRQEESKTLIKQERYDMKKFNLALSGAVLAVVVLAGTYFLLERNQALPDNNSKVASNIKITAVGDYAFGTLSKLAEADQVAKANQETSGVADASATAQTSNPAASSPASPVSDRMAFGMGGGGASAGFVSPYYPDEYVVYKYVYKGEDLVLTDSKMQVLKRFKGQDVSSDLVSLLGGLDFGLMNIGSFPGLRLQSASFIQSGGDEYNIYVSADEGSVNINGAWPKLYTTQSDAITSTAFGIACAPDGSCPEPSRIQLSDIPSDEELISIADAFLTEHLISTEIYGDPYIQNDWRRYYEASPDKANYYLPDSLSVIYPIKINDRFVYDESGNRTGLNVSVNIRNKKVVSVWDLLVHNYQASMYDAETDAARILKFAENGGIYGYFPQGENVRVVEVELGQPTVQMVKMWNYKFNTSEELLIPSLIFPVMDQGIDSSLGYVRTNVVVPLVKEMLDQRDQPYPMPLMKESPSAIEPAIAQ
jgi:hypothetical protein